METQHLRVVPRSDSTETPHEFEQRRNTAEQHEHILHFDFKGALKNVHKLEDSFLALVISEFESGTMLLGGVTTKGQKLQWAIGDNDGTIREFLTLPDEARLRQRRTQIPHGWI